MSDLPISVPPSEQYGQGVAQEEAQQQVPMGQGALGGVDPGGMAPPSPQQPMPEQPPMPGELGMFDGMSERPGEPVTTGINDGLGAGSEILRMLPRQRGADLLRRAAEETQDPVLMSLVERMQS